MKANFNFAVVNGYKDTFEQYVTLNYVGYCNTCKRCGFEPTLTQDMWLEGQE